MPAVYTPSSGLCYTENVRFVRHPVRERPLRGGKGGLLPAEETLLSQERGLKEPTNPAQKALLHKADENMPTPLELLSNPPQGPMPPFHPFHCWSDPRPTAA